MFELCAHLRAREAGHQVIHDDEVRRLSADGVQRAGAVHRLADREPRRFQDGTEDIPQVRIVVSHENARRGGGHHAWHGVRRLRRYASGSRTENVLP